MRQIAFNGEVYTCPFSEAFRRHSDEEEAAMREDVAANGVRVPIRLYDDATTGEANCILDGEGRLSAAVKEEAPPERVPFLHTGRMTTEQAYAEAKALNDIRRHDDLEAIRQRREQRIKRVVAARASGKSNRTIANEEQVSEMTVRNDLAEAGAKGFAPETPERVQGADGKSYPAAKQEPEDDTPSTAHLKEDIKKFRDAIKALVTAQTLFDELLRSKAGNFLQNAAIPSLTGDVPFFVLQQTRVANRKKTVEKPMWRCRQLELLLAAARRCRPTMTCAACRARGCVRCAMTGVIPADGDLVSPLKQGTLDFNDTARAAPWERDNL